YYRFLTSLSDDDIAGIRDLYGSAGTATPEPPAPSPAPPLPEPTAPPVPPPHPQSDQISPSLKILSPAFTIIATSASAISVSGTARDNVGVTAVQWTNSNGSSGTASGTAAWSAQIPLLVGNNVVIIRAYDAAGNSGWRAITVGRR